MGPRRHLGHGPRLGTERADLRKRQRPKSRRRCRKSMTAEVPVSGIAADSTLVRMPRRRAWTRRRSPTDPAGPVFRSDEPHPDTRPRAGPSWQLDRTINQHSVRDLKKTTTSAVALASNLIITDGSKPNDPSPSLAEKLQQVQLMSAAALVLRQTGATVAAEALLPDGTVIAGSGASEFGTRVAIDGGFQDALRDRSSPACCGEASRTMPRPWSASCSR